MTETWPGWHWRQLARAPHRLAFAAAVLVLSLASLWWLGSLAAWTWLPAWPAPVLAPALSHGAVMVFGFFPLFFAGFIFTVGPKWLRVPGPAAAGIAWVVLPQLAGWLLWLAASQLGGGPAGMGLGLALAGLLLQYRRLASMWLASAEPDRVHAGVLAIAGLVGVVSLAGLIWALLHDDFWLARAWLQTGLWGFVFTSFAAAAHRMVPVLSSDHLPGRWQSWSVLALLLGCAVLKLGLAWSDRAQAAGWDLFAAAALLLAGLALFWIAVVWARVQSLAMRMMTMLHAGFVWLALAFLLEAASLLGRWLGWPLTPLAALHAGAMGFMASVMLAMVERVSCAYSGRKLTFEGWVWRAFWLLQAATLARVGAELAPVAQRSHWLLLVAALWALALLPWCWHLLRWFGSPRPDGRPG